jgi:hypothetical protein
VKAHLLAWITLGRQRALGGLELLGLALLWVLWVLSLFW